MVSGLGSKEVRWCAVWENPENISAWQPRHAVAPKNSCGLAGSVETPETDSPPGITSTGSGSGTGRNSTTPATRQATSARIVKTRAKRIRLNRRSTIKGGPTETLAVVSRERPTSGNRHPGKPVRGFPVYYYHTPEFGHLRNRPSPLSLDVILLVSLYLRKISLDI